MKKLWEVLILILSLYVVAQLAWEVILPIPTEYSFVFEILDSAICFIFLGDFFYGYFHCNDKKEYLKTRWIDFISSIPFIALLRVFRIARVLRIMRVLQVLRVLRGIRGFSPVVRYITKNKLRSVLFSYIAILLVVLFYCSFAFYIFERDANELVKSYFDALWWSFITVTSVGYGDVYPKTSEGRLIAMVLTLCGMGMFSIITAELSAKFLKYLQSETKANNQNET